MEGREVERTGSGCENPKQIDRIIIFLQLVHVHLLHL